MCYYVAPENRIKTVCLKIKKYTYDMCEYAAVQGSDVKGYKDKEI